VWHPAFLSFFNLHASNPHEEIKLKQKKDMGALLGLITRLLQDYSTPGIQTAEPEEIRLRSMAESPTGGGASSVSRVQCVGGAADSKPVRKLKPEEKEAMAISSQRNKLWGFAIAAAAAAVAAYKGGVGEAAAAKAAAEAASALGASEGMANTAANAAILTTVEGAGVAAAGVAGFEALVELESRSSASGSTPRDSDDGGDGAEAGDGLAVPCTRDRKASVAAVTAGVMASKLWEEEGGESLDKLVQIRDVLVR
jgi:hypothetical protein